MLEVLAFNMTFTLFWELFINIFFLHVKILDDNLWVFVSSTLKPPLVSFLKGGSVEERLYKKVHSTANLNFLFLSLFFYLLKNCFSQFFSNWKSAEPVFCSEELSCLPYKNQNKSLTLSFGEGKFKFAVLRGLFIKLFFN